MAPVMIMKPSNTVIMYSASYLRSPQPSMKSDVDAVKSEMSDSLVQFQIRVDF